MLIIAISKTGAYLAETINSFIFSNKKFYVDSALWKYDADEFLRVQVRDDSNVILFEYNDPAAMIDQPVTGIKGLIRKIKNGIFKKNEDVVDSKLYISDCIDLSKFKLDKQQISFNSTSYTI